MRVEYVSAERIDIPEEQLNGHGLEFFGLRSKGFWKLTGPGIYIAMRGTGETHEVLYIGSAKNLLARISERSHESLREALKNEDSYLLLHLCKNEAQARQTEAILIEAYRPTFNINGKSKMNNFSDLIRGT